MRKGATYPLICKWFYMDQKENWPCNENRHLEILPKSDKPYYIQTIYVSNDNNSPINLISGDISLGIVASWKTLQITFPVNVTDLFGLELYDLSFYNMKEDKETGCSEGIVSVTIYSLNRGS